MSSGIVKFCKIHEDAKIPTIASKGSVGYDLYALEDVTIEPSQLKVVRTGLVGVPPMGYYFQLYIRSSVPYKNQGLVLANSVGIIDEDYVGPEDELRILLLNTKTRGAPFQIQKHQKIAQLVIHESLVAPIEEISIVQLKKSRGGLGSSGDF